MKLIATITAIAAVSMATTVALPPPGPFANCTAGPTQLTLTDYSLSPSPFCIGKQFCCTATGTLDSPIVQGGELMAIGRYLNRIVYSYRIDLCDALKAGGHTTCNIPAGPVILKICGIMSLNYWSNVRKL
ncbi:hypothetical protein BGZ96_006519 [Linnemannia gamsii]|uniref:Hydrophobin n=1 Tax=Linnemannia gamsii TaxID=64522 RepID=A0ABQ7K4H9_9FUNG|nr:hypothetical protein BGZ96_006519 [Linnemannia gamsii]